LLRPFGAYQGPPLGQERVDQGEAGVAYRTQAVRVGRVQLGWRACVPVSLGAERFGVLEVRLDTQPSPGMVAELERVATALALALAAAGRATDAVELARRGRPLSLPAEIQWELLPRLALEAPEYAVAGALEPAYEVGGDTFDYAAQPEALTVSVTDAMGHGLQAALLAGLAVAALRNARRQPAGLLEQVDHANQALHAQFGGERFVTGRCCVWMCRGGAAWSSTPAIRCPGWSAAIGSSRSGWKPTCHSGWTRTRSTRCSSSS
jgi:hypothetical protein